MRATAINCSESIIEAFWDPQLSEINKWNIQEKEEIGLQVTQQWCNVQAEWNKAPLNHIVLDMYKDVQINCKEFDHLMVSATLPKQSMMKVNLITDQGTLDYTSTEFGDLGKELFIPLEGAQQIEKIHIQVIALDKGAAILKWIGLHDSCRHQWYSKQWDQFDEKWEGYLKDETYEPCFEPTYGIIVDKQELQTLRDIHKKYMIEGKMSPFLKKIASIRELQPEKLIHEYVNFWTDTRYERERDYSKQITQKGIPIVEAAIILKDKELLRLAARYALSIAMCSHWNDGFICEFPVGNWEHRAFVKSIVAYEIGTILDLAGELFTDLGRDLILRRLGEEAVGGINYITWKHEYIFDNNQLIWFSHGRMLAYAILEKHFKHVKPYTEIAYQEIIENLNNILFEDGAYGEGPSYYNCIGQHAMLGLYYYSRIRGKSLIDIVPEKVKLTEDFISCLASTVEGQDVIPICDGKYLLEQDTLAFMAYLLPNTVWSELLEKSLSRSGSNLESIVTMNILKEYKKREKKEEYFIKLKEMGAVASIRKIEGEIIKIFVMSNKAEIDHSHEDKGSFVIEFAGETFAMDSGTCDYGRLLSGEVKYCQRHNMLVPYGTKERAHPDRPNHVDIKVEGQGNKNSFSSKVNLTPDWKEYYTFWERRISSPEPTTIQIQDDYELCRGKGVIFYWQTMLEVNHEGKSVSIKGKKGEMILEVPPYCSVEIDRVSYFDETTQNCIKIINSKQADNMIIDISVKLYEKK